MDERRGHRHRRREVRPGQNRRRRERERAEGRRPDDQCQDAGGERHSRDRDAVGDPSDDRDQDDRRRRDRDRRADPGGHEYPGWEPRAAFACADERYGQVDEGDRDHGSSPGSRARSSTY